ncbi:MAG: GNAT family N-acetyltransferase [Armatimonadetes bacterium]|nr:GNAT family N-acetyltransferase [Armatimonadota bacterium]
MLIELPAPSAARLRFLGPDATPAQLIRATAANHAAHFAADARAAGGDVHRTHGVTWAYSPRGRSLAVAFPRLPVRTAGAALDALMAEWRRRGVQGIGCWSLLPTRPRDLGARLAARGFEWGWQPHWMALDLRRMRADFPVPDGLRITVEDDDPDWDVDDLPYYRRRDPAAPRLRAARPRRGWRFGAWLDGRIVGQNALFLTTGRLGVAGIYNVGVVPAARSRGVGRAVSLAACQFARALGCHWATLNAATHIYERLGFVSLGRGQTWWMHAPTLAVPPPTPAQVAFAEAVGRGRIGDLNALLAQGRLPPDLDAPLPGGATPIGLAARAGKPAAVEWLVEHGATLEVIPAWDLGWKERVPRLLAERPDLANRRFGPGQITPLHEAAARGDVELARLLLAANPDLDIRDTQYNGTPLGWAHHLSQTEIAALIERHQTSSGG